MESSESEEEGAEGVAVGQPGELPPSDSSEEDSSEDDIQVNCHDDCRSEPS